MRLTAPKNITWWIAVVVGVVGIIANFVLDTNAITFWLVVVAFVLLALGSYLKGL